ncbi:MAG: cache domain-containing protein [Pseudomonadota bacterium]
MASKWFAALIGVACLATVGVYFAALYYFEEDALRRANARASFYESTLFSALDRFEHLPFILANDPKVMGAVDGASQSALNNRLEQFADQAGLEAIYLMDTSGLTVSASNHRAEQTFLGHNYSFRPYFRDAVEGRRGTFYAIGATTSRPGYFVAEPVKRDDGALLGVIAVKLDLSALQEAWRLGGEHVMVSNRDGVIVLSSDPERLYQTIAPISASRRAEIEREKQFGSEPLNELDWDPTSSTHLNLGDASFLHATATIPQQGWTLHFLANKGPVTERATLAAAIGAITIFALLLSAATLRSARLRAALLASQAHRRDLQQTNLELERAQADLARAGKMAALGQLAASVTHELGQPVSAMRNYLAAAEYDATAEDRRATLERLQSIVRRMENVTRQLKHFSRHKDETSENVDLRAVIDGAALLMRHDFEAAKVRFDWIAPKEPVYATGDRLRLEQVLVNLMRNAVAAMSEGSHRVMKATLSFHKDVARIDITDTGTGIGAQTIEDLQEPFHTTQPSGKGMGLGLAIAAEIAREHGGRLLARNGDAGGAVFSIELLRSAGPHQATPHSPGERRLVLGDADAS